MFILAQMLHNESKFNKVIVISKRRSFAHEMTFTRLAFLINMSQHNQMNQHILT